MKKPNTQKGFTLVELLIVILVIGVLAVMMILSSTEAVSSAKATKIISDLALMKRAINAWYLDNYERLHITDKNNGFFVDPKWDANKKAYTGGTLLYDYLNQNSGEMAKYFSSSGVSFNADKTNYNSKTKDQYGASTGNYGVYFGYSNTVCYVLYKVSDHNDSTEAKLKAKLKARANSAGLLVYDYTQTPKHKAYDGKAANVFMEAFRLDQ